MKYLKALKSEGVKHLAHLFIYFCSFPDRIHIYFVYKLLEFICNKTRLAQDPVFEAPTKYQLIIVFF